MVYERTQEVGMQMQVEQYAYLVKRIALHMIARLPASVQLDDLLQAGMIGLLEAAQKFDGSKGASFETYAGIRIRGAIVDEMRRGDWVPRSVHRNARRITETMNYLEGRLGREASDAEIAAEMEISLDEYHAMANDSISGRLFSLDETLHEEEINTTQIAVSEMLQGPSEITQRKAMQKALAQAIDDLPEREKLVLSLYYEEEMNLKEIGLVLGVSESRVCQIHTQAALKLKKKLSDW
ncbi:MAG: RNA polymerase sigma factor FliA [Cellvibrionaceae bacterium]|nr:RNA polymerase sigma factor FliA [Cellvibrionaceae bacterium]